MTKVLVVDDESIITMQLKEYLVSLGYEVVATACSGPDAVEKARLFEPDVVLMDIVMPGKMDGISASRTINEDLGIPVIFISAYVEDELLERAKRVQPYGYIVKPFEEREVRVAIELALSRRQMELRLKESESQLRLITDALPVIISYVDSDERYRFNNRAYEDWFGLTREELYGKRLKEVLGEEGYGEIAGNVKLALSGQEITHERAVTFKDGTTRHINALYVPHFGPKGEVKGFYALGVDITARKSIEEEMLKIQKLESLGVLAGGIAHDFNNLLAAILGNVSLAKTMADPDDIKMMEVLTEAQDASVRAKDLTRQLLTFSKGGAPLRAVASLDEVIKRSAHFALSGTSARLAFRVPQDLWPVEIDVGQISHAINNLLINAHQAMPSGGTVLIRAENVMVHREMGLPLEDGRYLRLTVEDEGPGIPEGHLSEIFDPFFTTKHGHSGLGLTTAYSIVRNHDGHITVESQEGAGTTFHIYLPASAAPEAPLEVAEEADFKGKGRVLVMDDDELVRNVSLRILEHLGYEASEAVDGEDAAQRYQDALAAGQRFDVVILDLTVPGGMGGREALKRLLEIDPQVNAIVSSGYSTDPIMANYQDYGFKGVVSKPYNIEELKRVLAQLMRGGG